MAPHLIKFPAGFGKTVSVLEGIASSDQLPWEIYVPTHALAEECKQTLLRLNPALRVAAIKGRDHPHDEVSKMCKKHLQASALTKAGLSVFPLLCLKSAGKESPPIKCDSYDQCPYIAQFAPAEIYIYTHAHLTLERHVLEKRVPYGVVIDESFFRACIDIQTFPASLLSHPQLPDAAKPLCKSLEDAIRSAPETIRSIVRQAVQNEKLGEALRALRTRSSHIHPAMTETEISASLEEIQPLHPIRTLFDNLLRSIGCSHSPQSVTFDHNTGKITVFHRKDISRRFAPPDRFGTSGPPPKLILLDASASPILSDLFFPDLRTEEERIPRIAQVIQCHSTRCATTSIVPNKNSDQTAKRKAQQRLADIQRLLARLASTHSKVLVVGPSAVVGNPASNTEALLTCPENAEFAHFNAVRGIDRWKDSDAILVIGRNQPPIKAMEDTARALFFDTPEPLSLGHERWSKCDRGYRYKHGQKGVAVDCHPDPRVQAVLEQFRELESVQAIDRMRLIHNTEPKSIYLLSNLPLDIDVDQLLSWKELIAGGSRIERAWQRQTHGVLPLNAEWLATNHPDLWPSREAAKKDVARKGGQSSNINSINNLSLFEFEYRPARQRVWSRCLSQSADPETVAEALTIALGGPVSVKPTLSVNDT
jgi:hypothetical protein